MALHFRNCRLPSCNGVLSRGSAFSVFFMRELFLLGGWTENSNDGDPEWSSANSILFSDLVPAPGFSVLAANPRVVTHASAPFTLAMVGRAVLALRASNSQNRIMARITEYINASTVKIDEAGYYPGFVDEAAIPGRILDHSTTSPLISGAWTLLDAPSGNNQARIEVDNVVQTKMYARPKGQAADPTETAVMTFGDEDDNNIVLNGYFDGPNALIYQYQDNDGSEWMVLWGEFENVGTGDSDPGFILRTGSTPPDHSIGALRFSGSAGTASVPHLKVYGTQNITGGVLSYLNRRLVNGRPGRAPIYKMLVWMDADYFIRGNIPALRSTNINFEDNRFLDTTGLWRHTKNGRVVPAQGPGDPLLLGSGA